MDVLLTRTADRQMFRRTRSARRSCKPSWPSPAPYSVSARPQIMLQLLVDKRQTLQVGDLVPVGDLWDVVAHGEEAFSDVLRVNFDNAKRLYHNKLRPMLEEQHEVHLEHDLTHAHTDPELAQRLQASTTMTAYSRRSSWQHWCWKSRRSRTLPQVVWQH